MYYLINLATDELAHKDSQGQHDGKVTRDVMEAAAFDTYREASEFSQNFGPDWNVTNFGGEEQ